MTSNLILASTSKYRRALLERLGVPFTCVAPGVDEDAFKAAGLEPDELARVLAREKTSAVARRHPDAVVIGSDQVCALGDEVLDKPGTRDVALERLGRLAGRTHRLVTAVCVARGDEYREFTDVTHLTMRRVTPEQIARYVDADEPFDCAGGYKLETRGIALFERIESADQTAIVGLPLMALVGTLSSFGFELP